MSKNSLGELTLSPLKEQGKFVFINREIRVNGKTSKGDYIKIHVDAYEHAQGKYFLKADSPVTVTMVVRGQPLQQELPGQTISLDERYNQAGELYKNQFYFGKVTS